MRKPTFYTCKNKDTDRLHSYYEADQRLCFHCMDSTIPLLCKFKISSHLLSSVLVQLVSDLFRNHVVGFLMNCSTCILILCLIYRVVKTHGQVILNGCSITGMTSGGLTQIFLTEPLHEKTNNLHPKTKAQTSVAETAKLISTFFLATQIVQSLFLNSKFQEFSLLL